MWYLLICAMLQATRLIFLKILDILYFELIIYRVMPDEEGIAGNNASTRRGVVSCNPR